QEGGQSAFRAPHCLVGSAPLLILQRHGPRSVEASGEETIRDLLGNLFAHFMSHPQLLPGFTGAPGSAAERDRLVRAVTDYIAGMTDRYAQRVYFEAFVPRSWAR
ncbi:MAG: hypothetical protein M1325_03315, partial [Actinobacteria bacterium]|nr:hypothetical protein [Actinomycetota bacterium]